MTGVEILGIAAVPTFPVALFRYLRHRATLRYLRKEREAGAKLDELAEVVGTVQETAATRLADAVSRVLVALLSRREHALDEVDPVPPDDALPTPEIPAPKELPQISAGPSGSVNDQREDGAA